MEAKKNPDKEVNRKRFLFLSFGLCLSLLLTLAAFEIKSEPVLHELALTGNIDDFPPLPIIPPTEFSIPKPPPVQFPKIILIPEEPDIEYEPPEFTFEPTTEYVEDIPIVEMPEEKAEDPGFVPVEHMASFPGGMQEWQRFLRKNIKYPRFAQRNHIEGKVHLSFYVDATGNISDIRVTRGIGGGCDEEAVRVLKNSPQWNPGLQRGVPVKSPMSIFIYFKLK